MALAPDRRDPSRPFDVSVFFVFFVFFVLMPLPGEELEITPPQSTASEVVSEPAKPEDQAPPSTTSRLLDAKRRAQKRKS